MLHRNIQWQSHVLDLLNKIHQIEKARPYGFELIVHNDLCRIWQELSLNMECDYHNVESNTEHATKRRTKLMMTFIQRYFSEDLSLQTIASSANISKSECVRCFRKCLNCSPLEYLTECRLSNAMHLLTNSDLSVTDISLSCGFGSTSYFSKVFKAKIGITPLYYRNHGFFRND